MSSPIRLIELAILERLRAAQRAYAGLTVESYAAQLDDELFAWVRTLPAVWVTFGTAQEVKRLGAHSFLMKATFEVVCAQRALQENAGRLNTDASGVDVGVYELLEDNKLALINQSLGLAIQPLTPGAIRPMMKSMVNRDAVVVYAQEFHTQWQEVYEDPASLPEGELQTVGFSYYLKPQHTPPVDAPDATDMATTLVTTQ
jgi:phage gp37-like protein